MTETDKAARITEMLRQNHQDTSIPEYLRTMACVHFESGRRVMPRYIDDEVFRYAADELERLSAALAAAEEQEPVAWEATTVGYKRFITEKQYQGLSEAARRWYKPYHCSNCDPLYARPSPSGEAVEARRLAAMWRDDAFEKSAQIVERYGADPEIAANIRALIQKDKADEAALSEESKTK